MSREKTKYFHSATTINEGRCEVRNVLVEGNRISKISNLPIGNLPADTEIINCEHLLLIPGVIDAHVHFRQPGQDYKADMASESAAAVAGGVTTVLDMPNNTPPVTTIESLKAKIQIASRSMLCNFGFFFGITNNNIDEALSLEDKKLAIGFKIFLGSSTGNMLVDNFAAIERLFSSTSLIISAHCEDENRIRERMTMYQNIYRDKVPTAAIHPLIRDSRACFDSSSFAVDLAKRHNTKLHVAHLTTKEETNLFKPDSILNKQITTEVTPSHLWFASDDYATKGNQIKCNPAIKSTDDRLSLRKALKNNQIDLIATDHAPHLWEEKMKDYFHAPSGIPSIQHSLLIVLELVRQQELTVEQAVEKMCHNPALLFGIKDRGFIKEGYFADLTVINPNEQTSVIQDSILYKCGWSPLLGNIFSNRISQTFVNGNQVFADGKVHTDFKGQFLGNII
ncbi:MAG: dihydroorotase [Bacteroidales bacterium]|nr:dihydroorotase [Bacteroidales bacterium]